MAISNLFKNRKTKENPSPSSSILDPQGSHNSLDTIPLSQATLCPDCNMISASKNDCIVCGNPHVYSVSNLLRRDFSPETRED